MPTVVTKKRCTLCWQMVENPCVTKIRAVRDASTCGALNQLPKDDSTGLPVRSKTDVSREADLNLHKVEEVIPAHQLREYAPALWEKTLD